ncbi:MAG: hypothetical protein L0Y76_04410 [Ignavibacteria bacterium]|nr:hypothetical protein [Ignavibacteria bacterium]
MFEQIIDKKLSEAVKIADALPDFSKESISASRLSGYIVRFLLSEYILQDRDYVIKNIEKAIKLHINYTLRPNWTLMNYIFGSSDSKSSKEILNKIEPFTYYSFYLNMIKSIALDGGQVSVKKVEIDSALRHINTDIYGKLTNETTGLKVKNFFLYVYRMKYGDNTEISLDMSVPYLYIRLFLEDKEYTDLVKKFDDTGRFNDLTEVELKNVIKVLTNKLVSVEDEARHEQHVITEEKDTPREEDETVIEELKTEDETGPASVSGFESEFLETSEDSRKKTELPTEEVKITDTEIKLRALFKDDEIKAISKKIFRGNRYAMLDALIEIEKLVNWREATNYLKNVFESNKVKYSDKEVILFVDVLNDYFEKRSL